MISITRYVHIRNRSLIRHGELICRDLRGNLDNFLDATFEWMSVSYPKFHKMDNCSKLGFLAAELLLKDMKLNDRYAPEEISLVLANSNGSLDTDQKYFESTKTIASPALFVYTLPNIVAGEICIRHKIKGENAFFVTPRFDIRQMYDYVEMVLAPRKHCACVVGWVNVLGSQHDVFLYLVEKNNRTYGVEHSATQLEKLYQLKDYGTVNS